MYGHLIAELLLLLGFELSSLIDATVLVFLPVASFI
jgi:hypothetical protein